MNCLHGIKISNDIAAARGKVLQFRRRTGQLVLQGQPLTSTFIDRKSAVRWATQYGATVSAV